MPHRKVTILVVDDIADDRIMTRMILEKHGFSVEEAGSAEELMDELKLGKLDLVVLDVQMPGLDCLNILDKIRQYNLESRYPYGKSDVGVILYNIPFCRYRC
jgi:CheY-like chemotaxis protein